MEFGFLNEQTTYSSKYFTIEPLPDFQMQFQKMKDTFYIVNGWLYPLFKSNEEGLPTKPLAMYDVYSSHTFKIKLFFASTFCRKLQVKNTECCIMENP